MHGKTLQRDMGQTDTNYLSLLRLRETINDLEHAGKNALKQNQCLRRISNKEKLHQDLKKIGRNTQNKAR